MNSYINDYRILTSEELSYVSGGGGTDPLPNLIYSEQINEDAGGPIYLNTIYTSQGEFIDKYESHTNEYLRDLNERQQIQESIDNDVQRSLDNQTNGPVPDFGLGYNYYNSFYFADNISRTFGGQPVDFFGVGTFGGELAYA